jgi:hypothetical protein
MNLFLRLYLSGGFEWPSIYRNSPGDQRSTFSVWRLAAFSWRGQNGANTFELTPAALLLGFEQPNLYEGFERPTADRQLRPLTAER